MEFMQEVHEILADDGIWVSSRATCPRCSRPTPTTRSARSTWSSTRMAQIQWMAERVGFRIVDVEFNDINGGSFSVTVQKSDSPGRDRTAVDGDPGARARAGAGHPGAVRGFAGRVGRQSPGTARPSSPRPTRARRSRHWAHRPRATWCCSSAASPSRTCSPWARSTTTSSGRTRRARCCRSCPSRTCSTAAGLLLVLPWHFRTFFVSNPSLDGVTLLFPLPELEVVTVQA